MPAIIDCNYITYHRFYQTWRNLKYAKKLKGVYPAWNIAPTFFAWAEENYRPNLVLHVINKSKPASPENCKFMLKSEIKETAHATHGLSSSPAYASWKNVINRHGYKQIAIEWHDLTNFHLWFIEHQRERTHLCRIDKTQKYSAGNCIFRGINKYK